MKIIKKVTSIIVVVILMMLFCMTNVYAVSTSLEDFVKTHNVENMSKEEITNILANITFDNAEKKQSCVDKVSSILADIDKYTNMEDKLKRLDEEFAFQAQGANNETDTFFLYYGYALGLKRVQVEETKQNIGGIEENEYEELQKKFDRIYIAYGALTKRQKKDLRDTYYNSLNAINEEIKSKNMDAYEDNLLKLEGILDEILENEPTQGDLDNENGKGDDKTKNPTGLLGTTDNNGGLHTPDEIIGEAQNFRNSGTDAVTINGDNLKKGSDTFYNILLSIGIFLAIAIGMYLGVKFMLSNAEDKAKVKEALIPYIAGCIVIFSAFIIWKVAILLLSGIK